MNGLVKWGGITLGVIVLVAVLALVAGYAFISRTVQPLSGELTIAGLQKPVSVVRDKNGVPHINAQSRADAALALGFSHAQDRLWQMELLRMTGQGRLSEMFGVNEDVQDIDVFLRTLGFSDQVESSFKILKPENKAALEAYSAGVNAFLERNLGLGEPAYPPEFLILGHTPEKWKPEHSLIVLKVMALQLSKNMSNEFKRMKLAAAGMSPIEIADILPKHRDDTASLLPDLTKFYKLNSPERRNFGRSETKTPHYVQHFEQNLGSWASNNWVLSGNKTTTGKPLLANDPHLSFSAPGLWYLAHLSWLDQNGAPLNMIGATIPSLPGIILGRNDHVAWGFTNAGGDVQDLFVERVYPNDAGRYFTADGFKDFEAKEEVIKIKGGTERTFIRYEGRNGPVLPKTFRDYGTYLSDTFVVSLKWTGLSKQDKSFDVISAVAEARSVEEFGGLVSETVAPMQAIVVADTKGAIGMFAPGKLPIREKGNSFDGRVPVPGWDPLYHWNDFASPDVMPNVINPAQGAIGTANSRIVEQNKRPMITLDWDEPYRHDRVQQTMVRSNKKLGVEDMIKGQMDSYSPALSRLRDVFLDRMESRPSAAALINRLRSWDGRMDADRPEPLFMMSFMNNALKEVYEDDLGAAYGSIYTAPATALVRLLKQGSAREWCDVQGTPIIEQCGFILAKAFDATLAELKEKYGQEPTSWRWGDAHHVVNEHQPFGKVWPLSLVFNIEAPTSGGSYTLLRTKNDLNSKTPYAARHGAGYRAIYDFSDLNKSKFIISTGQSGNFLSSRYADQLDDWANGNYREISDSPEVYNKGALGTWSLSPG